MVKVVTDHAGDAIYFSRCPIPYRPRRTVGRDRSTSNISACMSTGAIFCWAIPTCRSDRSKQAERLEQLRALENGYRIRVVETEYESLGVDTPEDLERVSSLFEASVTTGGWSHG